MLEDRLPHGLDAVLQDILGPSMPRVAAGGRYGILASGRFRSAITADLLAFACNNRVDAALILTEQDTQRVLYFRDGMLVGAASNVLFERIGRLLYQAEVVTKDVSNTLIDIEESGGPGALLHRIPNAAIHYAAERQVWEVVAALFLVHAGHFVLVEGKPHLDDALTVSFEPMQVALEGMRQHDQWRNGRKAKSA